MTPDVSQGWRHEVDRRMALAHEWDELVEKVRKLPGFEDFLQPPRLEALLPAAESGPVVIINVSRWRCDALVIRTDGVESIPLSTLTERAVAERTGTYLTAVQAYQEQTDDFQTAAQVWEASGYGPADLDAWARAGTRYARARKEMEDHLGGTLRWMWDEFVATILDHLGFHSAPDDDVWPRVWWCPTGALTLLPLHAAGHHMSGADAVLDRVVSSYTPTLRALLQARKADPKDNDAGHRMLFVGLSKTPGQPDLPMVERDLRFLRDLFPLERFTEVTDVDATSSRVLEELASHRWVHFSCHGTQNLTDPSHGGLYAYDQLMTIADISAREYQGDFAFLAACKTMTGGVNLPDEAITLAAALHYTGYRHVIAMLWSVVDEYTAQVTEKVYKALVSDGALDTTGAAWALHRAVRELRDRHRDKPSIWTPFTHTGP